MTESKNLDAYSFEEALAELEKIVDSLESGSAPLEKSIDAYERGMQLKQLCEKKLNEAQMKIERITTGSDGKIATEPFETAQ